MALGADWMMNSIKRLKTRRQTVTCNLAKTPAIKLIADTIIGAGNHDAGQRAAGVAYYALLSIFPLLLALVAIFGFFLPSLNLQDSLLTFVGNNIPGATNVLKDNIGGIIRLRGVMSILSILILFWSGSALFSAIILAVNRAWNINKSRRFFIRKASELGMVFATGLLFLLSLGASAAVTFLRATLNSPPADLSTIYILGRVIAFLLMFAVFLVLYKFAPNKKTDWSNIWPGALIATGLFELARTIFLIYVEKFANYQQVYGSLASVIILLVWIYYSSLIMILGAEFCCQFSLMRGAGKPFSGEVK